MSDLTEAQRQVLVVLLSLTRFQQRVRWTLVADAMGREGRARAAVVATLNRLVEGPEPLVAWGTEAEGDVVALTSEGVCVASDLMLEDLPRYEVTRRPDGRVNEISICGGLVRIALLDDSSARITGPDLVVRLKASTRFGFFSADLKIDV